MLWLVEPTTFIGGGEQYIIDKLQNVKTPIFLVINKTDLAAEEDILKAIVAYKDKVDFAEVIPVSAKEGTNTDDLIKTIFQYLRKGRCITMRTRSPISRSARSWRNWCGRKRCVS